MKNPIQILTVLALFYVVGCTPEPTGWAFHYPGDDFTNEALLDLRYLNESYAGEHGFIQLSEDGRSFVRGDGEPIRFWPVNGGKATARMNDQELAWHARYLAKIGVNMNRWHGSINPAGKGRDIFELDTAEVHNIWRFVAAMKKEGIYSTISPFWAHNGHMGGWVPEEWGIEGYSGNDPLWEVMYFNERLKKAYKTWVKYLYTKTNPYTGIALKDDPAVALIQIKNEDGVFWWTMQMVKPELKQAVSEQFGSWLMEKYGSISAALSAWENVHLPEDNPLQGRMDLYTIYEMTLPQEGGKARRLADQTQFYASVQYDFYREIRDYYRNELGCRQLINPNNWKTASSARLNDAERWTYTACEVPALNRYYAPGHAGEHSGWRIDPGHHYTGESSLFNPTDIPVAVKQIAGKPMLITESGWNLPQLYQSEAPALVSAYQSLTGHDAFYWFSVSSKAFMEFPYFEFTRDSAGRYAMNRWTCSTPGGNAQYPAYALMFRNGYIREGETVVHEERTLEEIWNREFPLIAEDMGFDPNRDRVDAAGVNSGRPDVDGTTLSPLTFLTGPVEATYGGDPSRNFVHPALDSLIDPEEGTVTSITGELSLNFREGVFTFDSPRAAGVSGFWSDRPVVELSDVTIRSANQYVTVGVISMDGVPLVSSEKILVQTGTTYRPAGWSEEETDFELDGDTVRGFRITDTGRMPWIAEPTRVTIEINNPEIREAWLLDLAGYPVEKIEVRSHRGGVRIDLPPEALYVVLAS